MSAVAGMLDWDGTAALGLACTGADVWAASNAENAKPTAATNRIDTTLCIYW